MTVFTEKKLLSYLMLTVIVMDILLFLLITNNYDVILLKKSNYLIPIALNIIMFIWLAKKIKGKDLAFVIIIILFLLYLLLKSLGTQLFHSYSYKEVSSPQKSSSIIIEYRNNLIDASISNYKIYQKKFGILMKELTTKDIIITVPHFLTLSQKEIFDFETPLWINEKKVVFNTLEGQYKFNLD